MSPSFTPREPKKHHDPRLHHQDSYAFSTASSTTSNQPWQAHSWRQFPSLTVLALLGAVTAISLAILVLYLSDDVQVDHLEFSPTVFLSILVTLSNALLRFAFQESADVFWWSRLLSESGVTLKELHTMWDLAHNVLSLAKFRNTPVQLHIRVTALLVLLLAVNGPLLQRALTVDLTTRTNVRTATLPIRQEPMWNLTTKKVGFAGHIWSAPPYQDEFAEIAAELNQRRPLQLSSSVCAPNGTCTANVTIAGFTHACAESQISLRGAPSLGLANRIFLPEAIQGHRCMHTGFNGTDDALNDEEGGGSATYCGYLETDFQLALEPLYPFSAGVDKSGPAEGEMAWLGNELPPAMMNYTTYVRRDRGSDMLSVRQCNFSTSFVQLPIQITEGSTVTLLPKQDVGQSLYSTNGIQSIPGPVVGDLNKNDLFIKGISQLLNDLYAGFIIYDSQEGSQFIQGIGSRQYINQSSITLRDLPTGDHVPNQGYTFSCIDPLADVLSTLDELSLRYALKSVPETSARVGELAEFMTEFRENADVRKEAIAAMDMQLSKNLTTDVLEERTVAVYRAHYVYTGVAVGVTYLTSILTMLLLRGFRTHGREFSMSPLEIAKAFNAPLLRLIGSNTRGGDIARKLAGVKVKYGEASVLSTAPREGDQQPIFVGGSGADGKDRQVHHMKSFSTATSERSLVVEERRMFSRGGEGGEDARLMIGVPGRVTMPVNGRVYI